MQEQNLPTPVTPEYNQPSPERRPMPQQQSSERISPVEAVDTGAARGDVANQAAPALPVADLPQPLAAQQQVASDQSATDTPVVADDVDVIEKVWVDKAKKIVKQTKSDPYEQEKQVNVLQGDYQSKRYGKEESNR